MTILLVTQGIFGIAKADEIDELKQEWRNIWNQISTIQVKLDNDWSLYMLPTYANIKNLWGLLPGWCIDADLLSSSIEDKTNGAYRINCTNEITFKNLLKLLQVTTTHSIYGKELSDLYIPKYFILEQEIKVDSTKVSIDSLWRIWYNNPAKQSIIKIFDPDFWNDSDWNEWTYEKTLYKYDSFTPNTWIEVFWLDWDRLSPETLRMWTYSIEHYMTSDERDKAYDSTPLFWSSTNTLKYTLNYFNDLMEEKAFREICNKNTLTNLYKNDDLANTISISFRNFLGELDDRVSMINSWDCGGITWLRTTNWSANSAYIKDNWSIKINVSGTTPVLDILRSTTNDWNSTNKAGWKVWLANIDKNQSDGDWININVPNVWVIWNKRNYSSTDNSFIKEWLNGKTVKLYYLVKMTSYFPWKPDLYNKYTSWLDPMNNDWYDYNNHSWNLPKNYLYAWHVSKVSGGRDWVWDANYFVMLWSKSLGNPEASTIYALSAPWYSQKWSNIRDRLTDDNTAAKTRAQNLHLNISQWYMETERSNKSNKWPDITLLSPVRNIPDPKGNTVHHLFRNYDADMELNPTSNTNNYEQNLNYVLAYVSNTSTLAFARNSFSADWLLNWVSTASKFWYNTSQDNELIQRSWSDVCSPDINNGTFWGWLYSLYDSFSASSCPDIIQKQTISSNYDWSNFYQQFEAWLTKELWWSQISEGLLLQTILNAWDVEVYNQIYTNTNYVVWLPNKDPIKCKIDLYKIPVKSNFWYDNIFTSKKDLSTDLVYSTPSNIFTSSPASYVDTTILNSLMWKTYNKPAETAYNNSQYKGSSWNEQEWLYGEKWIVTYKCMKNNQDDDNIAVTVVTSDKKYIKTWTKFIEQANTNKLSTPLFTFNTGSYLGYKSSVIESDSTVSSWIPFDNTNCSAWFNNNYIINNTIWWFNYTKLNDATSWIPAWNTRILWTCQVGRLTKNQWLFRWGIEVQTAAQTTFWAVKTYGKIDVIIYDKNRPWQIIDQKSYYITTTKKDSMVISADGKNAKWTDTTARGSINHTDGITFTMQNNSTSTINSTDTTTWLNLIIFPIQAAKKATSGTINNWAWIIGALASCTANNVDCWNLNGYTNTTNWIKTYSQDGTAYLDWVLGAWNTASPKLSIAIKSRNWNIINNTIVYKTTRHATSIAYAIWISWTPATEKFLRIILPANYSKLWPGEKIEVTLKANTNAFTAINWMRPEQSQEVNQATAFTVIWLDGSTFLPWISYANYKPIIMKTIANAANPAVCNMEFPTVCSWTKCIWSSWDGRKLYLSEEGIRAVTGVPTAKCWDNIGWIVRECIIKTTPNIYAWNVAETTPYTVPSSVSSPQKWALYNFLVWFEYKMRNYIAPTWYQFDATRLSPKAFEAIYPLKWTPRVVFNDISSIEKRKVIKFTQNRNKAIWLSQASTSSSLSHTNFGWTPTLTAKSVAWLTSWTQTAVNSIFKYPNFCNGSTANCDTTATPLWNINNSIYYWVKWVSNGNSQATAFIEFSWDSSNLINGLDFRNTTCKVWTVDFVTADPPPSHGYCNVLSQEVPNGSNNINVCDPNASWIATNNSISLEEDFIPWNYVKYILQCWNDGWQDFEWDLEFNISNFSNYALNASYLISNGWSPSISTTSNSVKLEGITIPWNSTSNVELTVNLKTRSPSCPDNLPNMTTNARLTSATFQSDLPSTTNSLSFRECKVPTLNLNWVRVTDWNVNNDIIQDSYTSAYPFEFSQCGNQLRYELEWNYECYEPNSAKISVTYDVWNKTDGIWLWRDPVSSIFAWNLYTVAPNIIWTTWVNWNMWWYNHVWSPSGSFWPSVSINPTAWWDFRMTNSSFTVSNVGSPNTKIKSPTGAFTKINSTQWLSSPMNMQIGLDPVVSGQKIYDNWIYQDTDFNTVKLHKEEIDGTSKKVIKTWTGNYEPIIFEAKVDNPIKNQSTYWMSQLMFDMSLNPNTASYFDKVDTNIPTSWSNIYVKYWEPLWQNQILAPGNSISYKWWFNVIPNLKTPNLTPANTLYQANWTPMLKFANDQGVACNFNQWFTNWTSEIMKNPITISSITFADEAPNSITPATDEISGTPFEQHLPWDTILLNILFNNNNSTRNFNDTYVKFTFDNTWSWKIDVPAMNFDFTKIFTVQWVESWGWITLNDNSAKCKVTATTLMCQLIDKINYQSTKTLKIPLLINIESNFYQQLKTQPNTKNWKYWYPTVISKIEYGTPDLNLINNVVYYTSWENELPSGWIRDDIETDDFNNPINKTLPAEPLDWKYSFYVGMPYASIVTSYYNASVWNISPWDILVYKTKISNIGKASLKNPYILQNLFPLGLKDNWVDVEVNKVRFTPRLNKTNIWPEVTIDFKALNTDANATNDVDVKNIWIIAFKEWLDVDKFDVSVWNRIDTKADKEFVLIDGSNTLTDGWDIELTTEMKIVKLKNGKRPQIDCTSPTSCLRANKNPKSEEVRWTIDLPFVWTSVDENDTKTYSVHFPILKSQLFAKSWNDYRYTDWANAEIKGMLNNDNTTVTYRLDNFISQEYTNHNTEKIGKARNVKSYVRLPMWVKYVPGSVKRIDNIVDGVNDPLYNTITPLVTDPIITEYSDYGLINWTSTNTFDNTFLTNTDWNKVPGSNDNQFQYMKWTPFKFNYFNRNYNYYRITDDGALALGYVVDPINPTNLNESQFYTDKRNWTMHTTWPVSITFDRIKQWLIIPNGLQYTNEKWEYKLSDGINPITVWKNSTITLNGSNTVSFTQGLEGVTYIWSNVDIFKSNIDYNTIATQWKNYAIISPAFIKLDLTKKSEHGVYEKVVRDWAWKVTEIWYQWFGYVEWTNKEVKFGIVLYNWTKYNNIKFIYGDIDNTLTIPIISWLSSWRWNVSWTYSFSSYNGLQLRNLSNKDDIEFDASPVNVYQELVFDVWYPADWADAVSDPVVMYQEKNSLGAYVKWPGKDQTSYIFQFNVRITTTDLVCWSEYSTSDGWNTLSWGKISSSRSDKDDIDQFCFSSLKPSIKILDNGSYSRWGYKTSSNNCTVNHLSLMWFNARAIWWNKSLTSAWCWLTYNIQNVQKDLSINTISPYDLLAKFKEKTDIRPVDTSLTLNDKKITFTLSKDIKVKTSMWTYIDINTYIPWFQNLGFKILAKNVFFIYGNDSTNWYLLRSSNEWDSYDIIYKSVWKKIVKSYISDILNIIFFNDWKFVRDTNGGSWPWSSMMTLVDYNWINDIWFLSSMNWFVLWNNWIMWKTQDGGQSFEKINLKVTNNLWIGESITSIDTYGWKDIWLSTSLWNVLYSSNAWTLFTKKTSWASVDTKIFWYEDWAQTAVNVSVNNVVWNTMQGVDTIDNGMSIKFDNLNFMLTGKWYKWVSTIIPANGEMLHYTTTNIIDFTPYITNNYVNADLYLDVYVSNIEKTGDLWDIVFKDNGQTTTLWISDVKQFNIDGSNTLKTWWNTIKVPVRNLNTPWKWDQSWNNWANISRIEIWNIPSANKNMQGSYFVVSNLRLAPITNLSNIQTVYLFPDWNMSKVVQDEIISFNGVANTSNRFSLSAFKKSDNTLDWYLTLDLYVSDTSAEFPRALKLWNSNNNAIIWNNLATFVKWWTVKSWWNTLILPFKETWNSNITYTNKYDINWWSIDLFKIFMYNTTHTKYSLFAIDNIIYSSTANTSFNFIRFFNTKEWVAYDQNKTYITSDNITWWNNEVHTEPWLSFINIVRLKWREVYGVANSSNGWISYYSLDKWKNSKKYSSASWINFNSFDAFDYDYWFSISSNNKLYRMDLVPN